MRWQLRLIGAFSGHRLALVLAVGWAWVACGNRADNDRCDRAVGHIAQITSGASAGGAGAPSAEEQAIIDAVIDMSKVTCRREGLSQAQADCILAVGDVQAMLRLRQCPAIGARRPSWLALPPTEEQREQIMAAMRPPEGPSRTALRFRELAGSGGATCGLRADGSLQCWGSPTRLPEGPLTDIRWDQHLCGRSPTGRLRCVSDTRGDDLSYLPQVPLSDFSEGSFHGCGIVARDRTLTCWAWESEHAIEPPTGSFTQVTSGVGFSCALSSAGSPACFGAKAPRPAPNATFRHIAAGLSHVCGIRQDGRLACFGTDGVGESSPPAGVFTALSCENWRCCAIAEDGALSCWGERLEDGPPTGVFEVIEVAPDHACAVGGDGTVCWGRNHMGQRNPPQPSDAHPRGG